MDNHDAISRFFAFFFAFIVSASFLPIDLSLSISLKYFVTEEQMVTVETY